MSGKELYYVKTKDLKFLHKLPHNLPKSTLTIKVLYLPEKRSDSMVQSP